MSSKYYEWLARNEKPEEKRELTPKEKRKNWWYYHKWHVLIVLVLFAILADLVWDAVSRVEPDYGFAYVGERYLPEDTVAALQDALAALGQDANGDGTVVVKVSQYVSSSEDPSAAAAAQVTLMGDILECESYFFLLEDPEAFQTANNVLCQLDGSMPQDSSGAENTYLLWEQCPVLAGLELGDYSYPALGGTASGNSQELLSGLALARRGFRTEKTASNLQACETLWNVLTEGANIP